jgi:hypothetical protein
MSQQPSHVPQPRPSKRQNLDTRRHPYQKLHICIPDFRSMSASSRGGSRGGSRPRRIAQKLSRLILRRQTLRLLLKLTAISTALCVLLQWLLAYPIRSDQRLVPPQLQDAKNLLVVTAHPDDECLFFAPAILGVLGSGGGDVRGGLLVLSTGNNYGLGEVRRKELAGSCRLLGVEEGRCVALDRLELQDDPNVWWDESIIQGIVKEYIQKWNIDAVRISVHCFSPFSVSRPLLLT